MKKTVFITGASSGIGLELAKIYLEKGYQVACASRRPTPLKGICDIRCNVNDKESVQNAIKTCLDVYQNIDILIANAGFSEAVEGLNYKSEVFERSLQTNVLGVVYCYEAVLPHMLKRNSGSLVSISSLAAVRGLTGAGAYCATKAALTALSESLRIDLHKTEINVSIIHPGYIKSELTDKNKYHMPFLLETTKGALKIFKAINKKKKLVYFPWPMALLVKSLWFYPCWVYDGILSNFKNDKSS